MKFPLRRYKNYTKKEGEYPPHFSIWRLKGIIWEALGKIQEIYLQRRSCSGKNSCYWPISGVYYSHFRHKFREVSLYIYIYVYIDVVGLYLNILHKEGLEEGTWYVRRPNHFDGQFNSFGRVCFEKQCFWTYEIF